MAIISVMSPKWFSALKGRPGATAAPSAVLGSPRVPGVTLTPALSQGRGGRRTATASPRNAGGFIEHDNVKASNRHGLA